MNTPAANAEGSMLAHYGWLFIVAGLAIAVLVSLAIPYAARRSDSRLPR